MDLRTSGSTANILAGLCSLLISLVAGAMHASETFTPSRIAVYFSPNVRFPFSQRICRSTQASLQVKVR
jgi:hypothetical protein